MKRFTRLLWLAGLLTLCLCLALTACDGGEGDVTTPTLAPTEAPTEPATEAPTDTPTEEPTDVPTDAPTDAPTDDAGAADDGCASVIGFGAVAVLATAAAVVALKKKD